MLKTFSIGGVHPHENKLSAHQPIITAEVPAKGGYSAGPAYWRACQTGCCERGCGKGRHYGLPNLPALFRQQFILRSVVKWRRLIR